MGSTARERILERANAIGVVEEPKPETTAKDRILSRAQQMGEIKTVEPMQQRSRQRSAADDLPDIAAFGAGNYGADKRVFGEDYNVGQGLAKAGQMGLTQVAKAGSSAGAWLENLLGDFAREGTNGYWDPDTSKWLFNRWNKAIDAEAEGVQQRYAENTRHGGKAAQVLEDVGAATVAAAPQAVAAILTGGASTAATAEQLAARAAASQGVMGTISRAMQTMGKDPNFRLAFAQVAGPGYEQAKADGADDLRASLYAIGNGLMNAAVEAGGGIQTLPGELKGGTSAWKAWVDSMLGEGKEEAVQGVIERAMQNAMYGKDNPLVGVSKGAVLDPAAAAEEFAGGAVVGGLLGGGQIGVQQLLGRAGRGNGVLSAAQEQGQAQDMRPGGEYARENSPVQGAEHSRQQEGGTVAPLGVSATQESNSSITHGPVDGNRLGEILAQIKNGRMDAVSAYDRLGGETLTEELESGAYGMDANDRLYRIDPQEHIDARDANNVGKRAMHAFQFDHPELHRYYQEVAGELLEEMDRVQRGGEIIKTQDSEPPFQERYFRTRRYAPENVERLLDDYEMSYKDIRRALEAIVNDKGQENFAAAKRVELLIDGMLENGYKSIYDGAQVAPNADYIRLKRDIPGAVEQPAENGGTSAQPDNDGLGGADRGSLNSDFQNMQMESDTFHPVNPRAEERLRNEQGRAPSEVPETNPDTKQNISKTVSTILNAPITSNEMAPVLEQSVADGRFDYAPVTDQAAMDRANGAIARNGGYQKAAGTFTAKVELGQRVTKDDFALGVQCYNEAVAAGDAATALELAGDLADAARTGAQVTQAVNLLNRLTPAGKLLTLRRYVDKLNRQSKPSRGRRGDGLTADERKALFVEEASTYAIDEQLATDYMMAETDEARAEAWQAIISDIASRVRPTVLEKWNAWRYTAMLTNPVTHVRNLAGNGVQALLRKTKNAVGTAIEAATVRNTDQRTKALLGRNAEDTARRELAAELYEQDKGLAMGAGKYTEGSPAGIAREIENARKMFGEKYAIGRGVQAVSDWNSAALDWGDALFNKPAYIESLAQTMKARGITAEEARGGAKADLMQSAREYAAREAAKATYRDFNTFSDAVTRLNRLKESDNRWLRAAGHAADAVLPFRRTPANILVRGVVDYSPVSFARVLAHDIRAVRNGSMTAPEMIDHIASGLTGTGILLLGYMLAENGLLHTKAGDDDREENFLKSVGYQDFALQIGDVSYTLDWMVPAAMPLFAGAALAEGASGDKRTADALGDALAGISDVVLETSMLSSLDQIMNGLSYAESKPWYLLSSALTSYISQGVPTIGGKAANILDDTVRKAYVPSDAGEVSSDIQYFWQSLMRKVPGGRNTLQPSVDVWGQEISNGSTAERLAESLVSPGFISVAQNDAVTTEVRRLAEKVGSGVYPSKAAKSFQVEGETVYLDGDKYTAYAKTLGQNRHEMLEQAMKLPGYKAMKDADKADMISTMYEYANAKAKKAVAPKYTMTKAMEKYAEAEKAGVSPAEWYMLRGGMDTDGNESVNQKEAKTALDRAGLTRQEKAALWPLISAGWKNNPYK